MEAWGKYSIWMKVILILMLPASAAFGQKQVLHQKQIWFKYYLKVPIGDNWQIRQEADDRNFLDPARQSQFLVRTHLQRKIGKGWAAAVGFAYFIHSLPQEPEVQDLYHVHELRPSFEITNETKLNDRFQLNHRYWTEFRFFKQPDQSYTFSNTRVRYKLELGYALSPKFSFLIFDELLINLGKNITHNVFDQNRYGAAIKYSPVENVGFELMYINWFQQAAQGDLFYDRDIVRVALHHRLGIFE
jgi:Protein of unknown function (DUF2490)